MTKEEQEEIEHKKTHPLDTTTGCHICWRAFQRRNGHMKENHTRDFFARADEMSKRFKK